MGNKPVISKQQILDTAFAIASESGLSGLSIREVARACNVAVGTVYNSYPTKYDCARSCGTACSRPSNEAIPDAKPCSPSCAARCTSPHSHEIMQQYERRPTCSI